MHGLTPDPDGHRRPAAPDGAAFIAGAVPRARPLRGAILLLSAWCALCGGCSGASPVPGAGATPSGAPAQPGGGVNQVDAPQPDADQAGTGDANAAIAAGVPSTDIWLLALPDLLADDGQPPAARNLTRRRGYDNQPAFSASGDTLYYTSIRDGRQADIYAIDLAALTTRQVTATPQSEYSPTPRPGGLLSLVQVALDGTQRLWLYAADGTPLRAVRPDITGVGYHAWLNDDLVALFVVAEPPRLLLAAAGGQGSRIIASNVGRALHRRADGTLGYVSKSAGDAWTVRAVDADSGQDRVLAATLPQREDLAWLPDGAALSGDGRTLYRLAPGAQRWRPLADLSAVLPGDISRIAVDPGGRWLALVAASAPED